VAGVSAKEPVGRMKGFKSKFCEGCKHFPCRDLDDDTEIFDCDYREYK